MSRISPKCLKNSEKILPKFNWNMSKANALLWLCVSTTTKELIIQTCSMIWKLRNSECATERLKKLSRKFGPDSTISKVRQLPNVKEKKRRSGMLWT